MKTARRRSRHRMVAAHWRHHWHRFAHYRYHRGFNYAGVDRANVSAYRRITPSFFERAAPGSYAAPQGASSVLQGASSVLNEARHFLGDGNVTGSHRAWCADFVNMVLRRTGHRTSGSGMARSLLNVGARVASPRPGDLVVMRGHVTIFAGYGPRGFVGLGGNQHHRVAMSNFPMRSVVAFVRPR